MNIVAKINFGRKTSLSIIRTENRPSNTLAKEVKRVLGLDDPLYQHLYRDEPININPWS